MSDCEKAKMAMNDVFSLVQRVRIDNDLLIESSQQAIAESYKVLQKAHEARRRR
jgi:hypothetical protein